MRKRKTTKETAQEYEWTMAKEARSLNVWRVTRLFLRKQAGRITKGARNTNKRSGGTLYSGSIWVIRLIGRLKKEMQMDDTAFDAEEDLVSGMASPTIDEGENDSDNSLAADLVAELEDLELDSAPNTVR